MNKPAWRHAQKERGYALPAGRPAAPIPADAAPRIFEMAAYGYTLQGMAYKLGTNRRTLSDWMKAHPNLQEAYDTGRAQMELSLTRVLYDAATKDKHVVAAIYLTKAKFGWREGEQSDGGSRVQINFTLPGARKLPEIIENEDGKPDPLALPKPRP